MWNSLPTKLKIDHHWHLSKFNLKLACLSMSFMAIILLCLPCGAQYKFCCPVLCVLENHCKSAKAKNAVVCCTGICHIHVSIQINIKEININMINIDTI